jgi:radical SAM/Cys-rich protein
MSVFDSTRSSSDQASEPALEGPKATWSLRQRRAPLALPEDQIALLDGLSLQGEADFTRALAATGMHPLLRADLEIFQINVGKLCNMTCRHCHVDAGPDRRDAVMSADVADACLAAMDRTRAHTVDLTGGAPELNPQFERLVDGAVARGKHVIDRCNLTILMTPRMAHLPAWLAARGVEVVASLPHPAARTTDAQRGDGTFEKSIAAMKKLNAVGYGRGDPSRRLTLMANPVGAFLAPDQSSLEQEWKEKLAAKHGVTFDRLLCLNNMPISRYLEWLVQTDNLDGYMQRLVDGFNPAAVAGLMCRNTVSIGYDGQVFDCDFNQMLDLPVRKADGSALTIFDLDNASLSAPVVVGRHCFGCTAGCGSSCGGATA